MADDSSVKMETLKKAYAEIILNTSKEAAARIMVADRRAMCFQKDLIALKEDALRLLVQVKQMADSKTAEAEAKSENQQRKIEVLEAQLSEAEGIIVDLREELRMTQDKLEEVKCSQWRPLKQKSSEDSEDQPPPLEKELIAKTDDERYGTDQHPSTENACGTKKPDEMALQYTCEDQLVMPAEVQYPSTEDARSTKNRTEVEKPSTSFQPSMLSQDSMNPFGDVKSSKEHCSSSSFEPDEQDAKLVANGSQAKSHEYESHQGQSFRDGSRRNRKNLKYQEAIAALRRSSHGKKAKSCQLPSLSKCRTKSVKQKKAQGDIAENKSLSECNFYDIQISEDEESAGICNRADNDKSLKFTFQRKRKREKLEKEDAAKLQKSIVKDLQSKDGPQLLQIAHQLISLSENGHS